MRTRPEGWQNLAARGMQRMSVATSIALLAFPDLSKGGSSFPLLMIVPIFLAMYLMMIRPQKKRQKQWQEMLANMKAGDSRGAGQHQAGSGQKRDCRGDSSGLHLRGLIFGRLQGARERGVNCGAQSAF